MPESGVCAPTGGEGPALSAEPAWRALPCAAFLAPAPWPVPWGGLSRALGCPGTVRHVGAKPSWQAQATGSSLLSGWAGRPSLPGSECPSAPLPSGTVAGFSSFLSPIHTARLRALKPASTKSPQRLCLQGDAREPSAAPCFAADRLTGTLNQTRPLPPPQTALAQSRNLPLVLGQV